MTPPRRQAALGLALFASALNALAAGPDRTKAPATGPLPPLHFPKVQKLALSNGIPVLFVERHAVPLLQLDVVLRAGASADPAERPGLASLTAEMLDRGAGGRSALDISDAVDTLGAELNASAGWDATTVEFNVPAANAGDAIALLSDLARRPTFPAEEIERVRKERLTALLQRRDQPPALASLALARALYGTHPYGRSPDGTEASMKAVTREDLRGFHARLYAPGNVAIIAVGDTTAQRLLPDLEKAFGSWAPARAESAAVVPPAAAPQVSKREIWLVDKPGAAQSEIRIARIGPPRATPRYFPLLVANTVLGGSFTSRLNHNLRTEHGYAYGAYSRFDFRLSTGPFFAGAAVQTDKTAPALTEFFKELAGIAAISPEDLRKAKSYVALRYPAGFETTDQIAGKLAERVIYSLPDDYFDSYLARVEAVTTEQVARAAAAEIDPKRVVLIVVGDATKIEKPIGALNLGPIRKLGIEALFRPR